MNTRPFVSIKKLKGKNILRAAAAHNLREIKAEFHSNGQFECQHHSKTIQNEILLGKKTSLEVNNWADFLIQHANASFKRKDAVRGLEVLFSLPPETSIDVRAYFLACIEWCKSYFDIPILSAVWHKDEAAPHCHILLLPLRGNRTIGSALMGNKSKLQAMQLNFFEEVGIHYGLTRPKPQKRLTAQEQRWAIQLVLSAIKNNPCLLDQPLVQEKLEQCFHPINAEIFQVFGITSPMPSPSAILSQKKRKTFVEIMTQKCKPLPKNSRGKSCFEPCDR